jgi:hypothetical protein
MDEGLPPSVDATPEELNAAARALRGLGLEPVPRDVAVRLERRLDDELGPAPAVRRSQRRPWWRATMILSPVAAAAVAVVAVVLVTSGGSSSSQKPRAAPAPTQGVAAGGAGSSADQALPSQALHSDLDAVALAAKQASQVADAAKAAALRARAKVCQGEPKKKGCPKPRAATTTTP